MKRLITLTVLLAVVGAGAAFAAVEPPSVPPRETEGPDIRAHVLPKGVEGPDVRRNTRPPFTGPEGPDIR